MEIAVRRIRVEEWPRFREFRLEALKDYPLGFIEQYDASVTQPDEFWQERVARGATSPTTATFVAVAGDGAAGDDLAGKASCYVEPEVTDHVSVEIFGVYVTPAYRGRAVADALFAEILTWSAEHLHHDRVRLFVLEVNQRARRCYQRLGFTETGATIPYPPDPAHVELEMVYAGTTVT